MVASVGERQSPRPRVTDTFLEDTPVSMKSFRLHRLFHPRSRRCFDVAIDHGVFNEHAFLGGIENIERAVATDGVAVDAALKIVES
jgi:DhnA family fructose-bisphosphate aldolase class Ia